MQGAGRGRSQEKRQSLSRFRDIAGRRFDSHSPGLEAVPRRRTGEVHSSLGPMSLGRRYLAGWRSGLFFTDITGKGFRRMRARLRRRAEPRRVRMRLGCPHARFDWAAAMTTLLRGGAVLRSQKPTGKVAHKSWIVNVFVRVAAQANNPDSRTVTGNDWRTRHSAND
jgi:hypothetical protein